MKEMNHIIARSASLLTEKGRPNPSNARKDEAVAEEKALRQKQEWEQHVESLKKEMEKQENELLWIDYSDRRYIHCGTGSPACRRSRES